MNTSGLDARSAAEIERDISARRESLKDTLNELEHRLSPSERINEMRQRIKPDTVMPWAAVGAVATGAMLAVRGLRRHKHSSTDEQEMDEMLCIDVAVPPGVAM
jgi:hypothetical protein